MKHLKVWLSLAIIVIVIGVVMVIDAAQQLEWAVASNPPICNGNGPCPAPDATGIWAGLAVTLVAGVGLGYLLAMQRPK
jgi:hypothetical protein